MLPRRHCRPQPLPGTLGAGGGPGCCSFWGRDEIGGHCRTDGLVCGPTSSPETARGENIVGLPFPAANHICKCSGFALERTRLGSVPRAGVPVQPALLGRPLSQQPRFRWVDAEARRVGLSTRQAAFGSEGALAYVSLSRGKGAEGWLTADVSLRERRQRDLGL